MSMLALRNHLWMCFAGSRLWFLNSSNGRVSSKWSMVRFWKCLFMCETINGSRSVLHCKKKKILLNIKSVVAHSYGCDQNKRAAFASKALSLGSGYPDQLQWGQLHLY